MIHHRCDLAKLANLLGEITREAKIKAYSICFSAVNANQVSSEIAQSICRSLHLRGTQEWVTPGTRPQGAHSLLD